MTGKQLLLFETKTVETTDPVLSPAPAPAVPRSKRLERAIRGALGQHVRVVLTDNRTTLISQSKRGDDEHIVRIHQMFLDGGDGLFADLAAYLGRGEPRAGARIDRFIADNEHILHHHVKELADDAGRGRVHDLLPMLHRLNAAYFENRVRADITWGKGASTKRRRRQTITLGSYDERASRITIHPALDQAFVPAVCVERVVHHEMLHAVFPPEVTASGRRLVHGPMFQKAEALFAHAQQADHWLDLHLDRLLSGK